MNFLENGTLQKSKNLLLISRFYGVVVITLDSESKDPSPNLGKPVFRRGYGPSILYVSCATPSNHGNANVAANEAREPQRLKLLYKCNLQ